MCVFTKDGATEMRCRGFGVLGVCKWYYDNIKGEKEGTPTGYNTYQIKLCMSPTFIAGRGVGPCRGDGTDVSFKLDCPVKLSPKCVAVGTCPVSTPHI